tara:strand:+ start:724 stop:1305 length:582 start_codon:yes stop_codon:yes gene_type:complete
MEKNEHRKSNKHIPSCFTRILDYLSCVREEKLKDVFTPVGNFDGDQLFRGGATEMQEEHETSQEGNICAHTDNNCGKIKSEQMPASMDNHSSKSHSLEGLSNKEQSDNGLSDDELLDEEQPLILEALQTHGVKSPYVNNASTENSGGLSTFFCRSAAHVGNHDGMYTEPELEAIAGHHGRDENRADRSQGVMP